MSVLSAPYMHDEAAAFAHVESIIWADGTVCPHCGVVDRAYRLEGARPLLGYPTAGAGKSFRLRRSGY